MPPRPSLTRSLLLLSAALMLTACAAGPQPTPDLGAVMQATRPVPVPPPASLLVVPPTLPPPRSGSMPDLLANHLAVARQYHLLRSQVCLLLAHLGAPTDGCPK